MKILHLSHRGLPDHRIERAAHHMRRNRHQTVFAGAGYNGMGIVGSFGKIYTIKMRARQRAVPLLDQGIKHRVKQIIEAEEPDIIHVHDVYMLAVAGEADGRVVYDDHEAFSLYSGFGKHITQGRFLNWFHMKRYGLLARRAIARTPTIVVSEPVKQSYRATSNRVYVVPNYPSRWQINRIARLIDRGKDGLRVMMVGRENEKHLMKPVIEAWQDDLDATLVIAGYKPERAKNNMEVHGFVPHKEMMRLMGTCHVGLIFEWERSWVSVQNRFSLMVAAGLIVLNPHSQRIQSKLVQGHGLGYCWRDARHAVSIIRKLAVLNERIRYMNGGARDVLVWEDHAKTLECAYREVEKGGEEK